MEHGFVYLKHFENAIKKNDQHRIEKYGNKLQQYFKMYRGGHRFGKSLGEALKK